MLTTVAIMPSAVCELRMASSRMLAVGLPKSAVSCELRWPYAASAPTIQPAVASRMTNSGAIEKAQ
jgi:hypothetical protein